MAARYRLGQASSVTTSGNAAWDVACSTGVRPRIREIAYTLTSAVASLVGMNRPTAIGTRTTPVALLALNPNEPALTGSNLVDSAVAFSVQPTLASNDLDKHAVPATIGAGRIWTWEDEFFIVDTSKSIALINRGTNGTSNITVEVEI